MSREEVRESAIDLKFPRHTLVSLLVFVVCWEVLSVLAPALGIPPFAIPSFVKIAKSFATITPLPFSQASASGVTPRSFATFGFAPARSSCSTVARSSQ